MTSNEYKTPSQRLKEREEPKSYFFKGVVVAVALLAICMIFMLVLIATGNHKQSDTPIFSKKPAVAKKKVTKVAKKPAAKFVVVAKRPRSKPKYKPGTPCPTGLSNPCKVGKWSKPNSFNHQWCLSAKGCHVKEDCFDGLDNDANGDIDCNDIACASHALCNPVEICTDGYDNDGDGFADCADSDCVSHIVCNPVEDCTNKIDDDGDGKVDCKDADCATLLPCKPKRSSPMKLPKVPKAKVKFKVKPGMVGFEITIPF